MTSADLWSREKLNGLNILCRLFCPPLLSYFIMFSAFTAVLLLFPISNLLVKFKSQVSWPGELRVIFLHSIFISGVVYRLRCTSAFCLVLACWHACHSDVSAMQMEVWKPGFCVSVCEVWLYHQREFRLFISLFGKTLSTSCSFSLLPCKTAVSPAQNSFLSLMDQTLGVLHHSNIPSKPDRTVQFLISLGLVFCPPSPTRFSRQLPQMRENGVPRDSPDEYYLTYSVLPGLSDSFWPYRSNAIFSLEDVDVSYARDVTSEYFLVIDLHLDAHVDSVCSVLLASGVLRFVIPVGSSVDMIWIRLCGRGLSRDIRWVWELCSLLHSGEAYGSGPKLDHGPTAGVTHWLTCMCAGVWRGLYFPLIPM